MMMTRSVLSVVVLLMVSSASYISAGRVGSGAIILDTNDPMYANNSLLVMNPLTGAIKALDAWTQSLAAIDYTYDTDSNTYFIETGLDTGTIYALDAAQGVMAGSWNVGLIITNLEYDATSKCIIGVQPDPIDGNNIVSLNLATKAIRTLASVPHDWEVLQDSSMFDIQNRTYCTFGTDSSVREILLCINIDTATGANDTHIWTAWVNDNPSPMENYRPINGSGTLLMGYVSEQGIVGIDLVTAKTRSIIDQSLLRGLPVVGGLSIDAISNTIYVAVGDAATDMAYLQVFALDSGRLLNTFILPDDVRYVAFFPTLTPPSIIF